MRIYYFLQKTWLLEDREHLLGQIDDNYMCIQHSLGWTIEKKYCKAGFMDGSNNFRRKSLSHCIKPVQHKSNRICAVKMSLKNGLSVLFVHPRLCLGWTIALLVGHSAMTSSGQGIICIMTLTFDLVILCSMVDYAGVNI